MNKRAIGAEKESVVCQYLMAKGYDILETNYWCRLGEIDIIARQGEYLVFVEVKYRKDATCGGSRYAIGHNKIRKICNCARNYICRKGVPLDTPMRFDVVAIDAEMVYHIENAFEYIE